MQKPSKLSIRSLFVLQSYWVGLSFMWNSLHVTILPVILLNYAPENLKNTYLGMLTFFGLIIAMIVQPISGSLSDRWVSKWGRRKPLILIGTLGDLLFLAFLGWAGGLVWLFIGYIGLQFTSNIAHGPAQGLMPDKVPSEQMGMASGIKNLMDMAGMVISSAAMIFLISPNATRATGAMSVVIVMLLLGAAVTLFGVREQPGLRTQAAMRAQPATQPPAKTETAKFDLRRELKANAGYAWLIFSRLLFLMGVYFIQTFAQYYVRDVIPGSNPVQLTNFLLMVIVLGLIGFSLLGGWLGDRLGHNKMLRIASLVGCTGSLLMMAGRTPATLLIFGSIFGAGVGLFLTSNWALANDLAPKDQAGKFLGLTNIATAGAGATARLIGPLIDLGNNARPGAFWGYMGMFLVGAVCILVSATLLGRIKQDRPAAQPALEGRA